ncbi:TadE-like protein [Planctomycetes bacterium MalM25]|nr:TadE-like protein [Planctomycetes bacterium MalM25]
MIRHAKKTTSRRRPHRRGVAATEFAICLPVLLLLLLGTIECCTMIFLKQTLAIAAYEGGHTALMPAATTADARNTCNQILNDRQVRSGSVQFVPANLDSVAEGDYFEVRVSAPTNANQVVPLSFFGSQTLQASAVFMKEI